MLRLGAIILLLMWTSPLTLSLLLPGIDGAYKIDKTEMAQSPVEEAATQGGTEIPAEETGAAETDFYHRAYFLHTGSFLLQSSVRLLPHWAAVDKLFHLPEVSTPPPEN